jgi:hypothetical protein
MMVIGATMLTILVNSQPVRKRDLSHSWDRPFSHRTVGAVQAGGPGLGNKEVSRGYAEIPLGPKSRMAPISLAWIAQYAA